MSGASLQVTSIPNHVTQDEFSRLFGQAQGCIGSRLVKIGNSEPVGYLDFLDPPSAGAAISTYSGWKGWGPMGLILRPAQPAPSSYAVKREREDAVVDPRLVKQMRPAATAYGAAPQGYGGQTEMRSPLHGQSNQVTAQTRLPAAQTGNANSLAYGMDSAQPAPRSSATAPQAYAGGPTGAQQGQQQGLSTQQLEAQRQQVRASIMSQMGPSAGAPQQPAYANDPRAYPASSLAPINGNAIGASSLGPGMLPVVEDKGPSYPQQQQQQPNQAYLQYSQGQTNDIKPAQGGPYLGASQLTRPLGGSAPLNIDPALLQSLQSLTQANQPPAQQAYPQQQQQQPPQQPQYAPQSHLQPAPQHLQQQPLPQQQQPPLQQQMPMPQHAPTGFSQPQYHEPPRQNGMQPSMLQEPLPQQPAGYGFGEIGAPVTDEELPPEAHHTLFMSGLPLDMQKREATHIFRPFEGYKELRLVQKQDKQGKDVMWCFVEFEEIVQAARCMKVLQGYSIDEEDPKAYVMRISYARPPQAGPGSQRVPTHVRRDAGPQRRPPQHEPRRDAHSRDQHPHPRDANQHHAGVRGPGPDDRRRPEGPPGAGQHTQDRGRPHVQPGRRGPPGRGGPPRGPPAHTRR